LIGGASWRAALTGRQAAPAGVARSLDGARHVQFRGLAAQQSPHQSLD
jgi:hypothetical protein